jgi:hypothetical protein
MAEPNLVDETEVPAEEPRFIVPPHFVVDELVRKATAALTAQAAELETQRQLAAQATADLKTQLAVVDGLKAQVADLQAKAAELDAQRATLGQLVSTAVTAQVATALAAHAATNAAPAVKA